MKSLEEITDPHDIAYIQANFILLPKNVPAGLPQPAYVLADGRAYVAPDHLEQEADPERFVERFCHAATALGIDASEHLAREEWVAYTTGIYSVCLLQATPENIARKSAAIARIDALLVRPDPDSPAWIADLRGAVDELDRLERPFSPVYDRTRFGRPPTRDSYIRDVRARYLHAKE